MLSNEQIREMTIKNRVYHLDMVDKSLDELVDEFLSIGNAQMASLWASMRLHLYHCGYRLGVEEKDRAVKFEAARDKAIEQQRIAVEILAKGETK